MRNPFNGNWRVIALAMMVALCCSCVTTQPEPDENAVGKEAELLSDAYYTAAKAKRQGLGLVQFIGELFKLNMLIERIMYLTPPQSIWG